MTSTTDSVLERTRALQQYIAEGRILDAMHEFYADDVVMQDDSEEPCRGLAANVEREQGFLDAVAEWKAFDVVSIVADDTTSFVESTMDFVLKDGQAVHLAQVSRAVWRDGKIVDERFYRA